MSVPASGDQECAMKKVRHITGDVRVEEDNDYRGAYKVVLVCAPDGENIPLFRGLGRLKALDLQLRLLTMVVEVVGSKR